MFILIIIRLTLYSRKQHKSDMELGQDKAMKKINKMAEMSKYN